MLRSFLLAPCLLVCFACATPFLTANLERGMTTEAVREQFGEPRAIETVATDGKRLAQVSWTYLHEEFDPLIPSVGPMPLRVAVTSILGVPLLWVFALNDLITDELTGINWDHMYVTRAPVVLQFTEEKLARWEVLEPLPSISVGPNMVHRDWQQQWDQQQEDLRHHKKGHKHHHGTGWHPW